MRGPAPRHVPPLRPAAERARQRDVPVPHRVRALADLRRHPHRQLRPRLLLHARRLPDLLAGRGAARRPGGLLRGGAARGGPGGGARRPGRGPAAPARLQGARALPAPPHLRAGAGDRRRGPVPLGRRQQDRSERAGPGRLGADRGPALSLLRPRGHRLRTARRARPLAALPPHALGRADPRRHPGSRDGRRARGGPVAALHLRVRAGLLPGRPRRRPPGPAAGADHRDGHLHHRGGVRGGGDRGHGIGLGRAARLAPHRRAQRLRRAPAAEDRHRADLRGDGGGAGGPAVGPAGPARDPAPSRRAAAGWRRRSPGGSGRSGSAPG